ncbi:MAG: hypothetical protein Kow0069_03220 [Promethearchaeota archaeon]
MGWVSWASKGEWLRFWALFAASRVLLAFFDPELLDLRKVVFCGGSLIPGYPSTTPGPEYDFFNSCDEYPPVFRWISALSLVVAGRSAVTLRLFFFAFEAAGVLFLHAFVVKVSAFLGNGPQSTKTGWRLAHLEIYAFNPVTLFFLALTPFEAATFALFCAGLYLTSANRLSASVTLLTLATLTEIYPAYFLALLFCDRLGKGDLIGAAKVVGVFTVTFFATYGLHAATGGTPFDGLGVHLSRVPRAYSVWQMVEPPTFRIGVLEVNLLGLLAIVIFGSAAFSYLTWNALNALHDRKIREHQRTPDSLVVAGAFFMTLPVVFLSIFSRYYFWGFPLWLPILTTRARLEIKKRMRGNATPLVRSVPELAQKVERVSAIVTCSLAVLPVDFFVPTWHGIRLLSLGIAAFAWFWGPGDDLTRHFSSLTSALALLFWFQVLGLNLLPPDTYAWYYAVTALLGALLHALLARWFVVSWGRVRRLGGARGSPASETTA